MISKCPRGFAVERVFLHPRKHLTHQVFPKIENTTPVFAGQGVSETVGNKKQPALLVFPEGGIPPKGVPSETDTPVSGSWISRGSGDGLVPRFLTKIKRRRRARL